MSLKPITSGLTGSAWAGQNFIISGELTGLDYPSWASESATLGL